MQTWQVCGLERVDVALTQPLLVAMRLKGVTRIDGVEAYNLTDALRLGGHGCILLERLIHEIAYKIARAAKYGA